VVSDFVEVFNLKVEVPWTICALVLEKFLEVDMMRLAVHYVLPHAAWRQMTPINHEKIKFGKKSNFPPQQPWGKGEEQKIWR